MPEGQDLPQNTVDMSNFTKLDLKPTQENVGYYSSEDSISNILKAGGIESKFIPTPKDGGFSEAIIIQRKETPSEKTVRVFRGVNQKDETMLKQVPYAMRADSQQHDGSIVLDSVRQEVDTLADDPTYEHFLAYVSKIRPQLIERQQRKLDDSLTEIEDGILRGYSVRKLIAFDQIAHSAGNLDSGVSPYVSASLNLSESIGYTMPDGVLIVMDVPISKIEDFSSDKGETNIKGVVDARYITAIIPRDGNVVGVEQLAQITDTALKTASEKGLIPVDNPAETKAIRENQILTNREKDKKQWIIDVEAVQQKRTLNLISQFPEIGLNVQDIQQKAFDAKTDIYTITKTDIFDYYTSRLGKIGRGGRDATDYEYETSKKFDRDDINDKMILQLRGLVQKLEQREVERLKV